MEEPVPVHAMKMHGKTAHCKLIIEIEGKYHSNFFFLQVGKSNLRGDLQNWKARCTCVAVQVENFQI